MESRFGDVPVRARRKVAEDLYTGIYGANGELDPLRQEEVEKKLPPRTPESAFSINNVCWLIASIAAFYFTDFPVAVMYDPRVHRLWLKLGLGLISINLSIGAFLILYLSCIKKISSDQWEKKYPAAIPIATAAFTLGACCLAVALWPLWGFLTPVLLFVLFMGLVVVIAMIPRF